MLPGILPVAGLFHGVIASSGSALHEWAMTAHQLAKARELAANLGIRAQDPKELVTALQRESAARIMRGTLRMKNEEVKTMLDSA